MNDPISFRHCYKHTGVLSYTGSACPECKRASGEQRSLFEKMTAPDYPSGAVILWAMWGTDDRPETKTARAIIALGED